MIEFTYIIFYYVGVNMQINVQLNQSGNITAYLKIIDTVFLKNNLTLTQNFFVLNLNDLNYQICRYFF